MAACQSKIIEKAIDVWKKFDPSRAAKTGFGRHDPSAISFAHFSCMFLMILEKCVPRCGFIDKVGNHEFQALSGAPQRRASRDGTILTFVTGPC